MTVTQQSLSTSNSDLLTYNIYGLDALTTYSISSIATNEGGKMSLESSRLTTKTMALQLPGPCPPPRVLTTTGASVDLQLIPPLDDGGGRIQGYNVYMATDDLGDFKEVATTIGTETIGAVEILHLSDSSDEPLLPETRSNRLYNRLNVAWKPRGATSTNVASAA
ncbi:histone-lysine N-methyltransferase CG1716 [Phytophthora cinnamomi]|uniref:histone-lysine N-methyltransferase CG1716 n=1 Tax=Phytophthora cinnamomi TaxID=4785 RepID=UPI003559ADD0|nr:histone-lysine N-methyltransferase CG1716 [Phytophthora cinnamomi]